MDTLEEINNYLQTGKASKVKESIQSALNDGIEPELILHAGLMPGMNSMEIKFKNKEIFIPELLLSSKAMNIGLDILRPLMINHDKLIKSVVIVGSVKGDIHDIGKNLLKTMLLRKGIDVVDLGVNVAPGDFLDAALETKAKVVCCSALLTTTMTELDKIVETFNAKGIRSNHKIVIGGSPVTDSYRQKIGADFYCDDAISAAELIYRHLSYNVA